MTAYKSLMIYAAHHHPNTKKGMPPKKENSKFELVIDGNVWHTIYSNNAKAALSACRSRFRHLYDRYTIPEEDRNEWYEPFGEEWYIRVTDREGNVSKVEG